MSPYLAVNLQESITARRRLQMGRATPASTRPGPQPLKCPSHKRKPASFSAHSACLPNTRAGAKQTVKSESALLSGKCGLGMVKRQLNKSLAAVGRRDERGASGVAAVELNVLRVDSSCCSLLVSYPPHEDHCGLLSGAAAATFSETSCPAEPLYVSRRCK